jgi:hypothetical protein
MALLLKEDSAHMNLSRPLTTPSRRPSGRHGFLALLVSMIAIACALPASTAASPPSASVALSVGNGNGKAAELLHRLTIPQLSAVLKTSPAQLRLSSEPPAGQLNVELGEALGSPTATLGEVLNLLSSHGVSPVALEELLNRLLAGAAGSAEQLRSTINTVLAYLREGGHLSAVANELGLPPAALEAAHLVPSTVEKLATVLSTTADHVSSALLGAGAVNQIPDAVTPLVSSPVNSLTEGATTMLVGAPNGAGGLSLTTINSTQAPSQPASAPISNAFSIVSIKVNKSGAIVETVKLPGPGRVAIVASALKKVALGSRRGHKRSFTRRATVASAASEVSGGIQSLTLRPGRVARGAKLAVTLITTYTPTGGSPNTIRRSTTVRRPVNKRHP